MLRFLTSGESHGPGLMAILDGFPAGVTINLEKVNNELWCRQQGYGRGSRQKIESDKVEIIGGIRHGITSGAPISFLLQNKDFENWQHVMSVEPVDSSSSAVLEELEKRAIKRFRPGHADLAGTLKFRQRDIRDVLERASARETAARVVVGALCQQLLAELKIKLVAHVIQVGTVKANEVNRDVSLTELEKLVMESEMFCADSVATGSMKDLIKVMWQEGDSLGGVIEVLADGLPVGLGSYTQWDLRIDGQLAQALMSVQAIKAVEIGDGIDGACNPGSLVHDAIYPAGIEGGFCALPFRRDTNHAGGIEGGMTNGERLRIKAYMKPIPTLRKGLPSISFPEFSADVAHYERSDVSAIAAASVVCKAQVAFVLAHALLEKFGGDTLTDIRLAYSSYQKHCFGLGVSAGSVAAKLQTNKELSIDTWVDNE